MEPKTVLIAHVNEEYVSEIADELETQGLKIVIAYDGNEAIVFAETIKPDLIVLGLRLSKRSGFHVLERLRQTAVTCPVVIVTDVNADRHRKYAELLGISGYFHVNEKLPKVVSLISELLEHSFAQTPIATKAALASE